MHSGAGNDENKDTVDSAGSTAVTVMMLATETVAWVHSDNRDGDVADHYSVPTIAIPFLSLEGRRKRQCCSSEYWKQRK